MVSDGLLVDDPARWTVGGVAPPIPSGQRPVAALPDRRGGRDLARAKLVLERR